MGKSNTKICTVDGCISKHSCRGYCATHYAHYRRHGYPVTKNVKRAPICSVEGCDQPHRRNGYCNTHSSRVRRHNDPHNTYFFKKHHTAAERKAALKASQRKYNQTPKGKIVNQLKRQRRRHLSADHVKLTTSQVLHIYKCFGNKCFHCGATDDLTMDHHKPLVGGNSLELGNTVILCRKCNGYKSATPPEKFYTEDQLLDLLQLLLDTVTIPV